MKQITDLQTLLGSAATQELLALIEKHKHDPALCDSLIIALEMLLSQMPLSAAKEIRAFAFLSQSEKLH